MLPRLMPFLRLQKGQAEEILQNSYKTGILIFVMVSFVFSLNLKSFIFEILFIWADSSTFYLFDDKVWSV